MFAKTLERANRVEVFCFAYRLLNAVAILFCERKKCGERREGGMCVF